MNVPNPAWYIGLSDNEKLKIVSLNATLSLKPCLSDGPRLYYGFVAESALIPEWMKTFWQNARTLFTSITSVVNSASDNIYTFASTLLEAEQAFEELAGTELMTKSVERQSFFSVGDLAREHDFPGFPIILIPTHPLITLNVFVQAAGWIDAGNYYVQPHFGFNICVKASAFGLIKLGSICAKAIAKALADMCESACRGAGARAHRTPFPCSARVLPTTPPFLKHA